jgi:glyoxylase-like metal-dependent hydrolase (beta-lactamase superfamily II)
MIMFGKFSLQVIEFGLFRLDGGAMFGSVPKPLWSKSIPADENNSIQLSCRSLLLDHGKRRFLIDVGMGEKWNDKQRAIYSIRNAPELAWGFDRHSVTDVILTHLHFDHAGGITRRNQAGELELSFPNARIHLQVGNWNHARNPTLKDRASYLPENITPLEKADLLLCDGDVELYPGITVHRVDGHTPGQQWIEIEGSHNALFFATDLVPTAHHLPLPYHMGYDVCAETVLREKSVFLEAAVQRNAIVFFEHDADTEGARVQVNEKGHFYAKEIVTLSRGIQK